MAIQGSNAPQACHPTFDGGGHCQSLGVMGVAGNLDFVNDASRRKRCVATASSIRAYCREELYNLANMLLVNLCVRRRIPAVLG
jgi:hypothetical protein